MWKDKINCFTISPTKLRLRVKGELFGKGTVVLATSENVKLRCFAEYIHSELGKLLDMCDKGAGQNKLNLEVVDDKHLSLSMKDVDGYILETIVLKLYLVEGTVEDFRHILGDYIR